MRTSLLTMPQLGPARRKSTLPIHCFFSFHFFPSSWGFSARVLQDHEVLHTESHEQRNGVHTASVGLTLIPLELSRGSRARAPTIFRSLVSKGAPAISSRQGLSKAVFRRDLWPPPPISPPLLRTPHPAGERSLPSERRVHFFQLRAFYALFLYRFLYLFLFSALLSPAN